jgi:hypothetical protein
MVYGLGCMVAGSLMSVWFLVIRIQVSGTRVHGLKFWVFGFRVQG